MTDFSIFAVHDPFHPPNTDRGMHVSRLTEVGNLMRNQKFVSNGRHTCTGDRHVRERVDTTQFMVRRPHICGGVRQKTPSELKTT